MKSVLRLLKETGKLKEVRRRGWMLHDIEEAETTAGHIFHLALLVWVVGREKDDIDMERALKMALVHDICEVHSPDLTSYDAAALDEDREATKEDVENIVPQKKRPTTKQRVRMEEIKKKMEQDAMEKLTEEMEDDLRDEIMEIWRDYEEGVSPESRLVKQGDKMINLFQGLDYYKRYGKIEHKLWVRRAKEVIDDEYFIALLKEMEKEIEE